MREAREIMGPEVLAGGVDRRSFLRGLVDSGRYLETLLDESPVARVAPS